MNKIFCLLSAFASLTYIKFYCLNVSDMVTRHDDIELFIPIVIMIVSLLLGAVLLAMGRSKKIDKKIFVVPLMFFVSAVITLVVGYCTPCELCTL